MEALNETSLRPISLMKKTKKTKLFGSHLIKLLRTETLLIKNKEN